LLVLVALLAADATRQKGFYDEKQTEEEENKGRKKGIEGDK
jgi:hypothetical protein